ncbi:DUF2752 domain-containing protein [Herbivorax sp. ANBcel31]|uniref:DUF2752 domain-containing protein n=1 Tax=Herbivorax sp. ANBcel31 TaxID=3069754 RepID=UPI0027B2F203|nr:DUF2752 domain-containing protein [Herbivorax sp. ANBcel31]MDQ2084977.1 DUF2752 domain-containing protein [Herbivorax sp. ANBcel31]
MYKLKWSKIEHFVLHGMLLMLCLTPLVLSFFLVTDGHWTAISFGKHTLDLSLPCSFKKLTGYNCPSCGMTRCFVYMSRLKFNLAWDITKAGVLLYIFCMVQIPYRLLLLIRGRNKSYKWIKRFMAVFLILIGIVVMFEFIFQFF